MDKELVKKIIGKYGVNLYHKIQGKRIDRKEERYFEARKKMYGSLVAPGELVFDVGANEGNRVKPLLAIGAKVVAVEPQESCYTKLRELFGNKIAIVTKGIDEKVGEKELHIASNSVFSSFSTEWIDTVKEGRFNDRCWNKTVSVEMTTLDALIAEYGKPSFIKIDVEGFELQVLNGLSQPIRYISFEYTVPEQTQNAIDCMMRLSSLDKNIKFNYSVEESMKWALKTWLTTEEMIEHVKTAAFHKIGFGDIYAHSEAADRG
ncbi:FkbM family methyltransferase [Dysgonomonas sp. 511]|uniref:FkbM family methyltransferase n=1 Tax=Dysgonomonas sp. 511 TaxID=2302930 RepID=UPI0013CF6751|nr:FkbM family methyltransferase [Dysgonomonas sp. 511]NDV79673.1 FkbM family methyltransferase [Dysgonomonas sp. 511]